MNLAQKLDHRECPQHSAMIALAPLMLIEQ